MVLNQLYSYSQMQETCGVIMLALVDRAPKVMGLKEMLTHYNEFQFEIITRRTQLDLKKAQERAHILEGLKIALDFIDEVIAILRASRILPTANPADGALRTSDAQASAIVAMRLGQLTGLERQKIEDELAALHKKIQELLAILADDGKIYAIVKEELQEIKEKFGDERRTEIQSVSGEVDIEDLIPEEDCVVTLTHFWIYQAPGGGFL